MEKIQIMPEIKPKKIKTKNINEALKAYASENHISLSECTFKIEAVETHIKTFADSDFKLLNCDLNDLPKDNFINEHIQLQQYYNIIISPKKESKIELNYLIEYGDFTTHPKIIILPDSKIVYKSLKAKELYLLLTKEINRIKAKEKMLINIFDESMLKNLKAFTKYIYAGKFTKKVRIPLFDGIKPEINSPSKLIMWYKEKDTHHQITEVEANEVIIEYKKPKFGTNGFNAYGELVEGGTSNNSGDLQLAIDSSSIKIKEDENKKQYIAKQKGFVNIVNNTLLIDNKMKMSNISRVEDTLVADEDNNIEVHVSQYDTTKDSVGEGVELTSEIIHIIGHVGANSILAATNLQIDGATHNSSTQFAKNAKINRHKGILRCQKADINLLENGVVHATTANIQAALGGSIYTEDVTIGHVKNNLKIYASNSIKIKRITGEDNILKINYKDIPIISSKIDFIHEDLDELKYLLEEASRHNKSKVPAIKEKIQKLKDELFNISNSTRNAIISIEKPLQGLNKIIFELSNGYQVIFKTEARQYTPFYLEFNEDNVTLQPVNKTFSITS